jgi:alanine-glyoxylate transaminase / serine-glyoxylate transaminase / serine-pyruvate transaminase
MDLPQLQPPERLLCGPGPTNVDPAVLDAMRRPMLGHLDPDLHDILLDVVAMLRRVYRMPDGLVLPLHCTGTAGMEAGIANLVEPGDTVIVGQCGFFGRRISEIARRHGAEVVAVDADWGECVSNDALLDELDRHPGARMVAVVHAETSTGIEHPLAELGAALRGRDTLLMADCVTSLAGVELDVGAWGVDFAYSCTQKCLAAPPGMSPIAVSERALERLRSRTTPVPFSFDLLLLERYWIDRPVTYHHTAPILGIYALHEALRSVLVEGLEARWPMPPRTSRLRWNRVASSSSRTPTTGSPRSPRCACRTAWTARRSRPPCSASTTSRSAAGSGPTRRRCGASALWAGTRPSRPPTRCWRRWTRSSQRRPRPRSPADGRYCPSVRRSSPGNTSPKRSSSSGTVSGCISSP